MPTNLVEVDEFTEFVPVPEPGDDRKAASVETGFQALANRTRNLLGRLTGLLSGNHTWTGDHGFRDGTKFFGVWNALRLCGAAELHYANEEGAIEARPRLEVLSLFGGIGGGEIVVGFAGIISARIRGAGAYARVYPLRLPHGATLQSLRAPFLNTAAAPSDFLMRLYRSTSDFATGDVVGSAPIEVGYDRRNAQAVGTQGVLAKTDFAEVITNAAATYYVVLSTSAGGDFVGGVQVGYLDPGPRNF